jgi:hypothetical protein
VKTGRLRAALLRPKELARDGELGSVTKVLVAVVVVAALVAFGGAGLLERVSDARPDVAGLLDEGRDRPSQSSAQMSAAEFLRLPKDVPQAVVEASAGEPESKHRVSLERVELECWYYGIAGATGAYQICFVDGKLRAKVGFGARA